MSQGCSRCTYSLSLPAALGISQPGASMSVGSRAHLEMHWVALSTHWWLMRPAPQTCWPHSLRLTCQGHCQGDATMPPATQASGLKPFTDGETRLSWPSKLPAKWGLEREALLPPLPLESITCGRLSEPQTVLPSGTVYDRCPLTCCLVQWPLSSCGH